MKLASPLFFVKLSGRKIGLREQHEEFKNGFHAIGQDLPIQVYRVFGPRAEIRVLVVCSVRSPGQRRVGGTQYGPFWR